MWLRGWIVGSERPSLPPPVLCPICGGDNRISGFTICQHHMPTDLAWHVANRIFCDLLHRGVEPPPMLPDAPEPPFGLLLMAPHDPPQST